MPKTSIVSSTAIMLGLTTVISATWLWTWSMASMWCLIRSAL
jgi:hypothetical protein